MNRPWNDSNPSSSPRLPFPPTAANNMSSCDNPWYSGPNWPDSSNLDSFESQLHLDSPHFGEDGHLGVSFGDSSISGTSSANNAGSNNNLLGSLDPNPGDGLFGQTSQSNANHIFGNTSSTESNIASVFSAQSSFVANQTQVVTSMGSNVLESKQSQANHASKTITQTPLVSTLSLPTQPPTQLVYASKSVAPSISGHLATSTPTVISSISGQQPGLILNTLTSQSPASVQSIFQGGVVQAGGHSMLQIQLPQLQQQQQQQQQQGKLTSIASLIQGASQTAKTSQSSSPNNGQPQLLPKMTSSQAKIQPGSKGTIMTMSTAMTATTVTGTTPLILNNGHMLTSMTQGQTSGPLLLNSLGQVVGSAGQAGSPILFQQQTGSPFIMLRQSAPTLQTTPTIIQTAGGQTGTILLQQPGAAGMINAQPQVKLITPQGRMQMQQIQTPSGPKLIAVPVGQATLMPQLHTGLTTGQNFTALSSAQILASGGTPTIVSTLPGGTTVSSSYLTTPTTIVSLGNTKVSQPQFVSTLSSSTVGGSTTMSQAPSSNVGSQPQKKKKSKKKKKESQNSSSSSGEKKQGLDLGELMKDVGLDLDNFGMEDGAHSTSISFDTSSITLPTLAQTAGTLQASTLSMMTSDATTGLSVSGSQLLAQIQQPLPMQTANTNQLQLVQGPNGQFVLQSTAQPATAYITQQSLGDTSGLHATAIIAGTSQTVTLPNQTLAQVLTASSMTSTVATTPTARTPSRRVNTDPNRVPLYEDDRLPPGWHRKVSQRKSGSSAGRYEVFIIGPTGKRFRSKNELKTFFEKTGERTLNPEDFDFSTFGTGRTTFVTPSIQTKPQPVSAPSVVGSSPVSTVLTPKPTTAPQPIVSSRASISTHTQSQVSLPQNQVMTPTILQPQPTINNPQISSPEGLPNLLQSITQPLPPKSLQLPQSQPVVVSSASSGPVTSMYQSQISMETADADAQISQLIETLQKDPQHLTIESDKMADFLKSFQQEAETPTSGPPNIASLLDQGGPPTTSTPSSSSMSPPILKPSAKMVPGTEDKGQSSSDDGSKPERTTGTTGFQASFLNSLANRRVSSDEDSSNSSPATPQPKASVPPSVVTTQFSSLPAPVTSVTSVTSSIEPPKALQPMSRGEMVPTTFPSISVPPVAANPSITMGGASTQMRAVQSLPPNTRLVRGPNGQYTLQKVQTIELSPEMQQSLNLVQNKIQEIEQKPTKSPLDEAELAQLQTKQQQILATGRPIIAGVQPPTPGGQGNLVPSRLANPVSVHQQLSLSTVTRVVPSGQQSSFVANLLPGQQVQPVVPTPKIPKAPPAVSLPSSTLGLSAPNLGGNASAVKPQVPHLTDQQKRIVAEFKQKMALLPQEQQAAFIAQHKSDLIKQLNFDPSQIQLLKGTSALQQRVPIPSPLVANPGLSAAKVILPSANPVVQGGGTPIVLQQVVSTDKEAVPGVGVKRPGSSLEGGPPVKHKKTAWVESQVRKDQNEALNPNYNVNFKSTEDACKRLLRYHVFGELDPNPMEEEQAQLAFEDKAEDLISKYQTMMDKYHYLLIQESMREASSSEDVMLARLWDSDERLALAKEKEEVKSGKLLPLPPLPESWSNRYEQLYGQKPPEEGLHPEKILVLEDSLKPKKPEEGDHPVIVPTPSEPTLKPLSNGETETLIDDDDDDPDNDDEEKDEDGKFVGLKISRSQSGSWTKQKHASGGSGSGSRRHHLSGEDPLEASMRKLHQPTTPHHSIPTTTGSEDDGSSSDEEFSLKDIDTSQAVGSILAEDHHEDFDLGFGRYDTPTMSGEGDADSVQNAINSILDLPQGERMDTPDLSNITGLLDSMEEEGEHAGQDAVTEAAVNSIPRF